MIILQFFQSKIKLSLFFLFFLSSLSAQSFAELRFVEIWQNYTINLGRLIEDPSRLNDLRNDINEQARRIAAGLSTSGPNNAAIRLVLRGFASDFVVNESLTLRILNNFTDFNSRRQAYKDSLYLNFQDSLFTSVPTLRNLFADYVNSISEIIRNRLPILELTNEPVNITEAVLISERIAHLLFINVTP